MDRHSTLDKGHAKAWAARADELALWAWRFVNRADVWGGYNDVAERGRTYLKADGSGGKIGKTLTRPARLKDRGKVLLTTAVLEQHFRATAPRHVAGLHTTSPGNTSFWGAVEVDHHGEGGNGPEVNLAASLEWYTRLRGMGLRPLLTDSNGAGGFHLRFLLVSPLPTPRVFAFLRSLTSDHARLGIPAQPETFPKQASVAPPGEHGQYGNWLRLPGRHHTNEHWSQVWDGERWLDGVEAVAFVLALTGDPAALVPEVPVAPPPARPRPRRFAYRADGACDLSRRIAGYLARLPNLGEGQGRDDVAFRFACWLVRNLALADDVALGWLERWDAGNAPPKGEARLREVVASAHAYGRAAYGCDLPAGPSYQYLRPTKRRGHSIIAFTIEVNR